ncbi:MAG: hypothetical protein Q8L60_11895 [Gammaproteobacteria bacterium]|nr:hypothetical protein [Gammaproteobacteria bacterium]MDP2141882.1 hypothetical protein [Gammaproteobacteria bacterium]MDP2348167.1 hypothetical protein [Gammaproteobacteria bacterium]
MPNVVKGSRQQRMIVVPYRPWYRATVVGLLAIGLLAVAAGGFLYGQFDASRDYLVTAADNARLTAEVASIREEAASLRSQVAISGRTSIMDQRANEEVQSTINGLRQRIMQLEQDVMFYRQVMAPEQTETGLIIAEFAVVPTELQNRYRYKAVFRQAGTGDSVMEGSAQIAVSGTRNGEHVLIPLQELVPEPAVVDSTLRFRYFQNIEGDMEVPEDFMPGQIEVRAESIRPTPRKVEKIFSWTAVVEG